MGQRIQQILRRYSVFIVFIDSQNNDFTCENHLSVKRGNDGNAADDVGILFEIGWVALTSSGVAGTLIPEMKSVIFSISYLVCFVIISSICFQ